MAASKVKIRALPEKDLDSIVEIDRKVLGKSRRKHWERKISYADIYPRPALVYSRNLSKTSNVQEKKRNLKLKKAK